MADLCAEVRGRAVPGWLLLGRALPGTAVLSPAPAAIDLFVDDSPGPGWLASTASTQSTPNFPSR